MEDYLIKIPAVHSNDPALIECLNIGSEVTYRYEDYRVWLFSGMFRAIYKIVELEEYGFRVPYKVVKQKTGEIIVESRA